MNNSKGVILIVMMFCCVCALFAQKPVEYMLLPIFDSTAFNNLTDSLLDIRHIAEIPEILDLILTSCQNYVIMSIVTSCQNAERGQSFCRKDHPN